jgi:hypothetical protein
MTISLCVTSVTTAHMGQHVVRTVNIMKCPKGDVASKRTVCVTSCVNQAHHEL